MSPQLLNRNVPPRPPAPGSRRVGDVKRVVSRGAWVTEHGLTTRGPGEGGAPGGGYRESGPPRDRAAERRVGPGARCAVVRRCGLARVGGWARWGAVRRGAP